MARGLVDMFMLGLCCGFCLMLGRLTVQQGTPLNASAVLHSGECDACQTSCRHDIKMPPCSFECLGCFRMALKTTQGRRPGRLALHGMDTATTGRYTEPFQQQYAATSQ